ncbi:MAG: hypothetical protein MHPSP_001372, partial [Paramarteilia canceri]
EIVILSNLRHRNIAKFYGSAEILPNYHHICMELCYTDLQRYFINTRTKPPEEVEVRPIILHILHALEYLELNRIVHNDIKPSNIGLNSRLKAKLLDFGSAYSLDEILVTGSRPAGTLVFQPPEFFLSSSNFMSTSYECFDCKTDIWSVGVTIYFICSHRLPYEGNTYFEILEKMRSTLLVFEDERFSQELQIFIRSSLARNNKQRPNAKECLNFEWIAKENQKCHKKFNKMIYRKKPKILKSVADKNKGHLRKKNLDLDFSDSISYTGLEEDPDFYESICWNRLPKKYRGSCI